MFAAALPAILQLLTTVAPMLSTAPGVTAAVNTVVQIAPIVAEVGGALVPIFKNVVATLKGNSLTTAEQLADLDKADAAADALADSALAAAKAADAAAAGGTSQG